MKTEKLYYVSAYLREANARVLSCEAAGDAWRVILDRTVFFPTGGGQPCDLGTLGGVAVTDVAEDGEAVVHTCAAPVPVGAEVTLAIDWPRRFMLMQQHSGEHLVSGIVHARYGYDNVGFHMGADAITVDYSGELTDEQLAEVEAEVNAAIWQNSPVSSFFPDSETLAALSYRSKKELTGSVRLVRMGGDDLCACCGTHVSHTGEIGLVKFLSHVRFHGGSRIELLCGGRALAYLNDIFAQNRENSALLSAKPRETAAAVRHTLDELAALKYRVTGLERQLLAAKADAVAAGSRVLLFEDGLSPALLRQFAELLSEKCSGAIFAADGAQFRYVLFDAADDLRPLCARLNAALRGRGGGKPHFVQGSVTASRAEIESFFAAENR